MFSNLWNKTLVNELPIKISQIQTVVEETTLQVKTAALETQSQSRQQ